MNSNPPTHDPNVDVHDDELAIGQLLREAGERVQPNPAMTLAVQGAVHAEWQTMVAQRKRRKQMTYWSMAASIGAVALGALLLLRDSKVPQPASAAMASIVKVQSTTPDSTLTGNVQISTTQGATWSDALAGEVLRVGMVLRTDPTTRAALAVGRGLSVRLDVGTYIEMLAADQIRVERGRVYIDASTAATKGHAPLTVQTAFGTVEHLGTQYQVQIELDRMTISVREGQVAVAGQHGKAQIAANERVTYGDQGEIARAPIASHDSNWLWAMQTAPTFDIEDRSLASFLDWVARETGRVVTYASPEARAQPEKLVLRGSVANLSPEQALRAVLATTQFVLADTETTIKISL